MSVTPEQPQRPTGPQSTEGPSSIPPQVSIKVVCGRQDLAATVTSLLDQPLMKQALRAAFPEPIIETLPKTVTTLKLVQSRSPAPGISVRGEEATVEYSDRAASNGTAPALIQRELIKRALTETALSGLRHFLTQSSLPNGCREEIQAFAQVLAKTDVLTSSELRSTVSDVIRSEHDRLQRQKDKLFKKLREFSASTHLPAEVLESRITSASAIASAIMSISLLVDQPGAKPEKSDFNEKRHSDPRTRVVEDLDLVVKELALNPRTHWSRAVFDGDFARADAIAKLRATLRENFRFDGFNASIPAFLSTNGSASVQANIDRLLRGSIGGIVGSPSRVRFSPESLSNASSYVTQALATTKVEQELRSWTTTDPDPSGLLREELLTICQKVPAALREARDTLSPELPAPLHDFIKTLCLYRLHGGTEGAAYFASVACHHTPDEARTSSQLRRTFINAVERGDDEAITVANEALQLFLSQIPASHPDDYVSLVNFIASWPLILSTTERETALEAMYGRLAALTTSVVYTSTKTLEESFLRNMNDPSRFDFDILEQFSHDVTGLAEAAIILNNSEVSAYMVPITESLNNLIDALKVETATGHQQLRYFGRLKRAFERQQSLIDRQARPSDSAKALGLTMQSILSRIQTLHDSLAVQLPAYAPQLRQELTELDKSGEIPEFAQRIADAVAIVSSLEPSEITNEIEAIIDTKVIATVNMIGEAWEYDQSVSIDELRVPTPAPPGLGFSRVSAVLTAGTWCETQLGALRGVFLNSSLARSAARVNHIDAVKVARRNQIRSALLQHPDLLADYTCTALDRIKAPAIRNASMIEAAERFLALDLDLRASEFEVARTARSHLQALLTEIEGGSKKASAETANTGDNT